MSSARTQISPYPLLKREQKHTQDLTPPINPSVYPVTKSLTFPVVRSPRDGLLALEAGSKKAARAGLCGRLAGQYWRSSLLSSWPVVDQLVRMLSLSSWAWRLRSSSFFFSQLTLSSWRDVPRLSCRAMYFS